MVCCSLGNFLPLGNNYLLISCDSLKIDVDSSLEGISPNSTREILLCNSRGSYFCALDSWGRGGGGSIYDTRFNWDLVDDLDSRRSFHDDIWSIKGCLMLLIHWDIFYGFNPLGMLLMLSIHWGCSFKVFVLLAY